MTAFENIISAIAPFGYPYQPDIYTGEREKYFVYNYADQRGTLFADETVIASLQLHFYLPADENFLKVQKQIRTALFKRGFTYPEVTVIREENKRHIIFECEIEETEEL